MPQGREIELYLNTATGEFVHEIAAGSRVTDFDKLNLYAGEILTVTVYLSYGEPMINEEDGSLSNPDTRFADQSVSGGIVVDHSYETYSNAYLTENITGGTGISTVAARVVGSTPRKYGYLYFSETEKVPYCDWEEAEDASGLIFRTAGDDFLPQDFVPLADHDKGSRLQVIKQPLVVSCDNDSSRCGEGIFRCTLDAANPVYEYYARGQNWIADCEMQFTVSSDGRPVLRARRELQCLGSLAAPEKFQYAFLPDWSAADSRYLMRHDLHGGVLIQARGTSEERLTWEAPAQGKGTWLQFWDTDQERIYAGYYTGTYWDWGEGIVIAGARGMAIDASPVVSPVFRTESEGLFCRLNGDFPVIEFASPIHDAVSLALWTVTESAGVTGNIALGMQWNGETALPSVAVPVADREICTVLPLTGMSGTLRLRRETDNDLDTLQDSTGIVSARITGWELRFQRN